MTVDPDEMLIFKMRGMKTAQKKRVEKTEAATPAAAATAKPETTKPQEVEKEQVQAKPAEIKERKPFFSLKYKPMPAPEHKPTPQPQVTAAQPAVPKAQETKLERKPFFAPKPAQPAAAKSMPEAAEKPIEVKPEEMPQRKPIFAPKPKPAPQAVEKPAQAKPAVAKENKPLFAFKPKPKPAPAETVKQTRQAETIKEMAQPAYSEEDEARMRELESLEQTAALYETPPEGLEAEQAEARGTVQGKEVKNIFSSIAGLLFIADAVVFGYFIFPQSSFVLGYVAQNGLGSLALSANYDYGIALVNIILTALLTISGVSLLTHAKLSHLVSGATGSIILLSVTFEYLNSNATYLLFVSVVTFIGAAVLAYARMSAVVEAEQEEDRELPAAQEINWPRLETF